jgi:predicted nucleotidyltransferase
MIKLIEDKIPDLIALCKTHRVESFDLFGSAVKNAMHEDSDLDFLVQFSAEINVLDYADNYFEFLYQLEILTGKKVDLVSKKSLKNPILIEEIERSKVELYAALDC